MSRSKVSQVSDSAESISPVVMGVNGSVAGFDLAAVGSEVAPQKPKLSVLEDFNLDELRADSGPVVPEGPDLTEVAVRRPKGRAFVFVHPEWRFEIWTVPTDRWTDPVYLVVSAVAERQQTICRRMLLVPYADGEGRFFLWPVLQEDRTGNINSRPLQKKIAQGAGRWCRYEYDSGGQKYRLYEAEVQREPPEWPAEGLAFLIRSAFEDRIIKAPDHEVLRRQRGKEVVTPDQARGKEA